MEILRRQGRQAGLGYLTALVATAIVSIVRRFVLADIFGPDAPLYLFLYAVVAAAWIGGLKPGLLATALSALVGTYFLIERDGWLTSNTGDQLRLALFLLSGAVISWFAEAMHHLSFHDISECQRLNKQLQEADRHKDEFLAILSHELRNPLAPMRNALQIIRLAGNNKAALEQATVVMERQLRQMVRLIDDLTDVSRISRNKLKLHTERIELGTVVQNAVEISRPLIEAAGHELTIALPSEPLFVNGDAARLAQVFSNLLNNAAKYTERGGRIRVTVEQEGKQAVVRVKDTGIGISAEHLLHIFEMFTQVERSLERAQGGLGIGLTLAKRLIEMHGGVLEAHSEGTNKGSEFIVRLPEADEAPAQPPPSAVGSESQTAAQGGKVLIVDDDADTVASMSIMLRILGYEIQNASDGVQAVETASRFRPDVVLLDITLPKMNGYEVARRIRRESWGKSMKLVALTGWGQEEDKRRSLEAGFDHHLTKPWEPSALGALLKRICTSST